MSNTNCSNGSSKPFYSVDEVSKMFGVSPKSVYRLLYRGKLKSSRDLRHKMITWSSIQDFIAAANGNGGVA
jgi:predicted DNA-binding transcriptional regulator AlpA